MNRSRRHERIRTTGASRSGATTVRWKFKARRQNADTGRYDHFIIEERMSRKENARAHYRVVYPATARPRFREFGVGVEHTVLDCSEKGLRFRSARPPIPAVGSEVEGTIEFPDGEQQRVAGIVVRTYDGEVAIHLSSHPIPFTRIIQQQRFLRQKFPLNELIG